MSGAFQFNHNPNIFCRLVANIFDAFYFFLAMQIYDFQNQVLFVYSKRDGGDDNLKLPGFIFYNFSVTPDHYPAFAVSVSVSNVLLVESNAPNRKIRGFNK